MRHRSYKWPRAGSKSGRDNWPSTGISSWPLSDSGDVYELAEHLRLTWRPSRLVGVRVYRGRPSPDRQPIAAAANDRQADRWSRNRLVTVIRRPLHYRVHDGQLLAVEKGVDVALAVDLVHLAITSAYDAAILVSRDTDLMPALETIRDLRAGWVEVAAWCNTSRLSERLRSWGRSGMARAQK